MSSINIDAPPWAWNDGGMGDVATVAEWIAHEIRDGAYAPGQRLVEADLVAASGATRAMVRAALHRLSVEGLVVVEPFRGASVRRFATPEIVGLYRIREVLEGLAARMAAERDADVAPLLAEQAVAEAAVAAGSAHAFMEANARWHAALVALAANPDLSASLSRLRVPILRLLSRAFLNGTVVAAACASQRAVTEAVAARDPDAAEARMRAHLRAGLAAVIDMAR
jgi:DNA-binding GntR family transcriptional regulator